MQKFLLQPSSTTAKLLEQQLEAQGHDLLEGTKTAPWTPHQSYDSKGCTNFHENSEGVILTSPSGHPYCAYCHITSHPRSTCPMRSKHIDLMRVPNSSLLSKGPKSKNNFSCRANCSGKDKSLIEYLHLDAMWGNTRYDTLISARLIYFILGHLSVRESTCSSFYALPGKIYGHQCRGD